MSIVEIGNSKGDTAIVSHPIIVNDALADLTIAEYKRIKSAKDPLEEFHKVFPEKRFPYVLVYGKLGILDRIGMLNRATVKAYLAGLDIYQVESFAGTKDAYTPLGVPADNEIVDLKKKLSTCEETMKLIDSMKRSWEAKYDVAKATYDARVAKYNVDMDAWKYNYRNHGVNGGDIWTAYVAWGASCDHNCPGGYEYTGQWEPKAFSGPRCRCRRTAASLQHEINVKNAARPAALPAFYFPPLTVGPIICQVCTQNVNIEGSNNITQDLELVQNCTAEGLVKLKELESKAAAQAAAVQADKAAAEAKAAATKTAEVAKANAQKTSINPTPESTSMFSPMVIIVIFIFIIVIVYMFIGRSSVAGAFESIKGAFESDPDPIMGTSDAFIASSAWV